MSYLVLARKYRPQNFEELVGQKHIADVLKNAIVGNRIAHAYLFAGPRGTGKTTTARILSKALNCLQGPTPNPCNKCTNCKEITEGNSVDVLEIDGASNRGIDEIRALRENVKFTPASSKYKIYIIDESHQITDAAFNALLKTLEEPPEHVIFILATTEPQKIPLTILSRCQRFRFRPISVSEIINQLEKIVQEEKFNIEKNAIKLIAQVSNGSLRDSLSMLDQVVSFSPDEKITEETVREILGLSPYEIINSFFDLVVEKNTKGLLEKISWISYEGYDFVQFAKDVREYFRLLIIANYLDDDKKFEESYLPADIEKLKEHSKILPQDLLLRNLHLLNKCVEEIRWSDNPRLVFELYSLKLIQEGRTIDELISELEEIEKMLPSEDNKSGQNTKIPACPTLNTKEEKRSDIELLDIESNWNRLLSEVEKRKPLVASILKTEADKKISNNQINLYLKSDISNTVISKNISYLEQIAKKIFGETVTIKYATSLQEEPVKKSKVIEPEKNLEEIIVENSDSVIEEEPGKVYEVVEEVKKEEKELVTGDHTIKKILETFSGKIVKEDGVS